MSSETNGDEMAAEIASGPAGLELHCQTTAVHELCQKGELAVRVP